MADNDSLRKQRGNGGGAGKKRPLLGKTAKFRIAIVIVVLFAIIVFQNTQTVSVKVFWKAWPMPLVVLMLLVFLTGSLCGYVLRRKR